MENRRRIRETMDTPVLGGYDVIVCGGGVAGVIPVAVATGQAAGTAAALCVKNGQGNASLDRNVL